jgi:hypothetical protein
MYALYEQRVDWWHYLVVGIRSRRSLVLAEQEETNPARPDASSAMMDLEGKRISDFTASSSLPPSLLMGYDSLMGGYSRFKLG